MISQATGTRPFRIATRCNSASFSMRDDQTTMVTLSWW